MSVGRIVTVVAAVIEDAGRLLVTRRPEGTHLGGFWEFPGGKTAPAESHAAALEREIREELDAHVEVHELVHATTHDYTDRAVSLFFYRCTMTGEPRAVLGQQMRWVAPHDLADLEFPPADAELIRMLVARSAQNAT
jgi:8-oxo-dGTP diphosphatase